MPDRRPLPDIRDLTSQPRRFDALAALRWIVGTVVAVAMAAAVLAAAAVPWSLRDDPGGLHAAVHVAGSLVGPLVALWATVTTIRRDGVGSVPYVLVAVAAGCVIVTYLLYGIDLRLLQGSGSR